MRYIPAIVIGRVVRVLARWRKPGGGSAVPGLVVNAIAPGFLASTLNSFPQGLIIVSGSSGKSTTTKMLVAALRAHGLTVFTNASTANIRQGLTSALLEQASLSGRVAGDIAVLEMDEGHGAKIAPRLSPRIVALTNVMVDQIDRFHDSDMVAGLLQKIAVRATGIVVINADDAYLASLGAALESGPTGVRIHRYGVSAGVLVSNPRGLGYTRTAPTRLSADRGLLITEVAGRTARLTVDGVSYPVSLPARGAHYAVDAATAVATARAALGSRFNTRIALTAVGTIPPVFGRGEVVTVRGHDVEFEQILVAIGSDVRDPSYFWPVDTSSLRHVLIASGSKAHDIALQLVYDNVTVDRIEPDLGVALDAFLDLPRPVHGLKTIIFSADGMRRARSHLGLATNAEEPV